MPATCDVDMNTRLVKRYELQVFDLDRNPVLWRRSLLRRRRRRRSLFVNLVLCVAKCFTFTTGIRLCVWASVDA